MTPGKVKKIIVMEKTAWIREMIKEIKELPISSYEEFISDKRNIYSAEAFLRRAIEGLFDLLRHILSKGFGDGTIEYKKIAKRMEEYGVVTSEKFEKLIKIAGYRNRIVHFYQEISSKELFEICSKEIEDIEEILNEILFFLKSNKDIIDFEFTGDKI